MTFTLRRSLLAMMILGTSGALSAAEIGNRNISENEVLAAQEAWAKALIQISDDYAAGGEEKAKTTAESVIDSAYGYAQGVVLFKPTLASGQQTFRLTREGALSYFIGGNPSFPIDKGFAIKGWKDYKVENAGIQLSGDSAYTMGKVHLTDADGKTTTVDKTWGFRKGEDGQIRIVLHHSSVPYAS